MKVGLLEDVRVKIMFFCPVCGNTMTAVGINMDVHWCKECQQAYEIIIRKNRFTKAELKNVVGFPDKG